MADATFNGTPASALVGPSDIIVRPQRTRRKRLLTLADVVDNVLRVEDINPGESRAVDRAIFGAQSANRSFSVYPAQGFKYYNGKSHITFNATISVGTVTVVSNVITPAVAPTWPTWMQFAQLRLDGKTYQVLSYTSGTATVEGLPDGTYTEVILQHGYARLPEDFRRRGSLTDGNRTYPVVDVSTGILRSWEDYYEWANSSANPIVFGAIAGDERFQGELLLAVWPPYTVEKVLSLHYERYPRDLQYHRVSAGTVSTVGTAVTTTSAVFTSEHIGCAITFSTGSAGELQLSLASRDLVSDQRIITAVATTTTATMDIAVTGDITAKDYYISDVVDVLPGTMTDAFLRMAEWETSRASKSKYTDKRFKEFRAQMDIAMADDARYQDSIDDTPYVSWGYGIGEVTGNPD